MRNLSGKDVNGMGKGRWQHVLLTVTMRSRKANIWSQRTSASYQSRVRCKAHARFIRGESAARRLPILIRNHWFACRRGAGQTGSATVHRAQPPTDLSRREIAY